jgi:nucleotide-binding universal stress UspA family protein
MKIVVAFNDSEDGRAAVACAAGLSRQDGAEIHLVYAVPAPAIPPMASPKIVEELMTVGDAAARHVLDKVVAELAAAGVPAVTHTRRWLSVETVLEWAKELGAELIVVGRRGSHRVTQLLIGTVSSEIVRLSPISVLVVHKGHTVEKGSVLVAVDGSPPSKRALAVARATWPAAPIVACHVVPAAAAAGEDRVPADTLAASGVDLKGGAAKSLRGDPAEVLLAELEAGGHQAIVLGTRGLGPLKGLLLGSVTEKVLQLAKRPVLVAR